MSDLSTAKDIFSILMTHEESEGAYCSTIQSDCIDEKNQQFLYHSGFSYSWPNQQIIAVGNNVGNSAFLGPN